MRAVIALLGALMWIFWPGIMYANPAGRARSNLNECHWVHWSNPDDGQINAPGLSGLFAQISSKVNLVTNSDQQDNRDALGGRVFYNQESFNKLRGICWDPEAGLGGVWPRASEQFIVEGSFQAFMNARPALYGMIRIETTNNTGAPADNIYWTMAGGDQWDVHQWSPRAVVTLVPGACVGFRLGIYSGVNVRYGTYPSSLTVKQLTNCEEDTD